MTGSDAKTWFAAGVKAHMDSLYGFAYRLTRNRADAEDLVAESVAKAWSAIDGLNDPEKLKSWLFRIVHNEFVSHYRKKATRPTAVSINQGGADDENDDDLTSWLVSQSDAFLEWWGTPEKEFANKVMGRDIMAAMEALPDDFRAVLTLVTVQGLSYDETADVLAIPQGTVRSRMKRGRLLLQKALWKHAEDAGWYTTGQAGRMPT